MKADSGPSLFEKIINSASSVSNWLAHGALLAMLLLTAVDLAAYKLLRWSFGGSYEISGVLGLLIVVFALPHTQIVKGQIAVDFFVSRMPKRAQKVLAVLISLLGLFLFILITWQMLVYGLELGAEGRVTPIERIPLHPFAYITVACSALMSLVILVDLIKLFKGAEQ
ncbi:TRAP transporter small permease [Chloroflexota bacterium]